MLAVPVVVFPNLSFIIAEILTVVPSANPVSSSKSVAGTAGSISSIVMVTERGTAPA